ncbi:hypothetical protein C0J52_06664 [Blattella germanica]|nr:hypothetical protein C0J52_06664 [Blattella germanica]
MQISRRSLHRILKSELKFHPYKLQVVHKLRPNDRQMRMTFCAHLQEMIAENNILPNLLMSDEAHFHLTGFVNKQNFCSYQMAKAVHCFQINCMLRY